MTVPTTKKLPVKRSKVLWIAALAGITLLLIGIGLGVGLGLRQVDEEPADIHGAVSAISQICADIGSDILKKGGSAVDAMIATLLCENVSTPQSMGLAGGFVGIVYTRATSTADAIIARESAPSAATEDMFKGHEGVKGILSMAVPGELKGYAEMHERFGLLSWAELVQPSIDMCRNGFPITRFLDAVLTIHLDLIRTTPTFNEIFWNQAENRLVRVGEIVKRFRMAETLELIAAEGPQTMYSRNGTVARRLIKDIQDMRGIITIEDLENYQVRWERPDSAQILGDKTLYTTPLPASGSLLVFVMNFLDGFLPESLGWTVTFYHRIIESFKYAYARRTHLGDPKFVPTAYDLVRNLTDPNYAKALRADVFDWKTFNNATHYGAEYSAVEDHGTAHISVLAPNGDAVSVTSTVNAFFGCKIISPSTGLVLNDEMDDFSTPGITNQFGLEASPANYIAPEKIPLSSMCPAIIVNTNNDVEMIIGAAGGSKITTAVSLAIVDHLLRNRTLEETIRSRRLHHQLLPMVISYETDFDANILSELIAIGHATEEITNQYGFGAVSGISQRGDVIESVSDPRRYGCVSVF